MEVVGRRISIVGHSSNSISAAAEAFVKDINRMAMRPIAVIPKDAKVEWTGAKDMLCGKELKDIAGIEYEQAGITKNDIASMIEQMPKHQTEDFNIFISIVTAKAYDHHRKTQNLVNRLRKWQA